MRVRAQMHAKIVIQYIGNKNKVVFINIGLYKINSHFHALLSFLEIILNLIRTIRCKFCSLTQVARENTTPICNSCVNTYII